MTKRRPSFNAELRVRALAAYREHRSYRAAAEALGVSLPRCHVLVREGLQMEMESARDVA